jgi:hypothetical protein
MRKKNACGLCEFGDTKKFLYLYVTLEGKLPVKARSTLFTGLETMLFDDVTPESVAWTTYISDRMKGIREHYENVAVGGGRNRQPSTFALRKRCSTGLNSSVSGN